MSDETFDNTKPPASVAVKAFTGTRAGDGSVAWKHENVSDEAVPDDFRQARRRGSGVLTNAATMNRLPPHSVEAEQGVLGCILLGPSESSLQCLEDCQTIGVTPDWFYELRHRTLFHRLTRLKATEVAIDMITVRQALRDAGQLGDAGGDVYLVSLPDKVPSAANLMYYVDILREKFHARKAVGEFTEAISTIYESGGEAGAILGAVQKRLEELTQLTTARADVELRTVLASVIDRIEDGYHRGSAQIVGLTTGLDYIDKLLCGFGGEHGNLNLIAARPNVGKTALAMQIALHVALDHKWFTPKMGPARGKPTITESGALTSAATPILDENGRVAEWEEHRGLPVGVFSMEMTAETLINRTLFQRARADAQRFRTGFARKEDFDKLAKASIELNKAKIHIDETSKLTIEELAARTRSMARQHGIKLFVIDYVQLIQSGQRRFRPDRFQEMGDISNGLRDLGKSLGVPLLVVAQMNREFEKEPNRPPRMADLRDCGALEQDADTVMFLYPKIMKGDEEEEFDRMVEKAYGNDWAVKPQRIVWFLAKNRYGPNNMYADLLFQKSSTLFLDFNAWKKEHGFKAPAKGEAKKKEKQEDIL